MICHTNITIHTPNWVTPHGSPCNTHVYKHEQERDLARKLARLKAQDAMEREAHADLAAYLRGKHEVGERHVFCLGACLA